MRIEEIAIFTGGRNQKKTVVKKKTVKQDDSLSQKVQDRLKQIRKQQGTIK